MKNLTLSHGRIISFFIVLFFFSCKKEKILNSVDSDRLEMFRAYQNGPKVKDISFTKFLSQVNQSQLGNLKQQFNIRTGISKLMSINLPETFNGFAINTDNIKMVEREGHISYVFSVKLASPHAVSFQNLTIDQAKDKTIAFVSTYTPSKTWISNFKNKKYQPFEGEIKITRLNIDDDFQANATTLSTVINSKKLASLTSPSQNSLVLACSEYFTYSVQPYPCNSSDLHMPGEGCAWEGQANGPGYRIVTRQDQICETFDGGGGSGGGSGGTTPNPDPEYDPCAQGAGSGVASFAKGTRLQLLPPPCDNGGPITISNLEFVNESLGLTPPQSRYVQYHPGFDNDLITYLNDNGPSQESKDFLRWGINYLIEHPLISTTEFKNYFLFNKAEGADGLNDYDENYWNDPNLVVQTQTLPTFFAFSTAYPKNSDGTFELSAAEVFNLVGGIPKALRDVTLNDSNPNNNSTYGNACALRVSRALNYSGVTIPSVSGTYVGGDGKNYFLSAASLNAWMIKAFPPTAFNSITLTSGDSGTNGANFQNSLAGKKGIYILIPNYPGNNYFAASGHAGLHTTPPVTHYYLNAKGGVQKITLWTLY